MSACGTCKVCCTVMGVEDIRKVPGERCVHLGHKGCTIYQFRPQSCREFECVWLQMTRSTSPLSKRMRPDRSGVMFVASDQAPDTVAAHCSTAEAFDAQPVKGHVDRWLRNGITVIRIVGDKRTLMSMKLQ